MGRAILRALEARALGYGAIVLDTTVEQIAARRIYESAGYRENGRRQAGRFHFIDYRKELDPPA